MFKLKIRILKLQVNDQQDLFYTAIWKINSKDLIHLHQHLYLI